MKAKVNEKYTIRDIGLMCFAVFTLIAAFFYFIMLGWWANGDLIGQLVMIAFGAMYVIVDVDLIWNFIKYRTCFPA